MHDCSFISAFIVKKILLDNIFFRKLTIDEQLPGRSEYSITAAACRSTRAGSTYSSLCQVRLIIIIIKGTVSVIYNDNSLERFVWSSLNYIFCFFKQFIFVSGFSAKMASAYLAYSKQWENSNPCMEGHFNIILLTVPLRDCRRNFKWPSIYNLNLIPSNLILKSPY